MAKRTRHIELKHLLPKDYIQYRCGLFAEVSIDCRFLIGRREDGVLYYVELKYFTNDLIYEYNNDFDIIMHNGVNTQNNQKK